MKSAYKNDGINADVELLDTEARFSGLRQFNSHALMSGGSLNEFAGAISRVAEFEGIDFPQTIDTNGAEQAMS